MNEVTTAPTAPVEAATSNGKTALTDSLKKHFAGDAPLTDKAKNFAKERPWTSAAFVGIAAVALGNLFRGRI